MNLTPQDITTLTTRDDITSLPPNQQETKEVETNEPQHQSYENNSTSIESELEELSLDEINELLGELEQDTVEPENPIPKEESTPKTDTPQEGDNDLIDEILKEIEMGKK